MSRNRADTVSDHIRGYAIRGIYGIITAMNEVTVSVICTNYNKGAWIRESIESFLSQKTSFTFEIVLIDDASTDNSKDIVREYAKRYPDKIRAFYNKKNLGITQTWVKICKEAKGKYIARCDGDDYWIDDKKLQKQFDILESRKDSEWCSTDCDTLDENQSVQHAVFENNIMDHADTYAKMLATRGFTAPSTWLVRTTLMQEINKGIDKTAIDDTFNIQLDLFNKTNLSYLPESTTVYRISEGSDSRPKDMNKVKLRNDGLLRTQQEYVEKYKNTDYSDIINILLQRSSELEFLSIDRLRIVHEMKEEIEKLRHEVSNRDKQIQLRDEKIVEILESKRYKIGKMLVSPVSTIRANGKKKGM